jgi:polyphosphate kinase
MKDEPRFFHRELSWLRFNERVLGEALDARLPLLERARFLAIAANNLDEFVMVRFALLLGAPPSREPHPSELSHSEQLTQVRAALAAHTREQYLGFEALSDELAAAQIELVPRHSWSAEERESAEAYFWHSLEPTVTPLAVGPSHPFPMVGNLQLFLALELAGLEGEPSRYALVGVPSNEPRVVMLSSGRFGLLEDVLRECVHHLFPGFRVVECGTFRVTRDGTLDIDEDPTNDLLSEIEQGLRSRGRGPAVRLEVEAGMQEALYDWLRRQLELAPEDVVRLPWPLDLTLFFRLIALGPARPDLQFPVHRPELPNVEWEDPFAAIREQSLLLHHPYDAFDPVVELVQRAAHDPKVIAIKQTLYRVSGESPIVEALIDAAEAGKQVTVLCELKARFDERRNITWARRLEEAGAHVLYGVIGYKVHAKLLLVIRRDEDGVRRYVHAGTGNYNDKTARIYEDLSYFTSNEAVCRDVANLFNMLTGFSRPPEWERLLVAPLTFRSTIEAWIDREAEHARGGRKAQIFAKLNSLEDTRICEHLYRASAAGVPIDLVVRGICILRPGVVGLSENIRVRSVVGRFLEHSRFFYFANAGCPEHVIGSGDWMTRNLDRRVENLVRITEPEFRAYLDELRQLYLADERNSHLLQPDGSYVRARVDIQERGVQERLELSHSRPAGSARPAEPRFLPARPSRTPASS